MKGEVQIDGIGWHSLGDALYRKWSIYENPWLDEDSQPLSFDNFRICGSSLGGPVALISRDKDVSALGANAIAGGDKKEQQLPVPAALSKMYIYTSSGKLISQAKWPNYKLKQVANTNNNTSEGGSEEENKNDDKTKAENMNAIIGMGWSEMEQLVVVLQNGRILLYDIHCKLVRDISLFDEELETDAVNNNRIQKVSNSQQNGSVSEDSHQVHGLRVLECHFWANGIVAMASDMQVYVLEGLTTGAQATQPPRRYRLETGLAPSDANRGSSSTYSPYTSMAIVPPLLSRSGLLEVMLGTPDNSILVVDENEVEDQLLQDRVSAPITKMSVAPNGHFLACYRRDGVITVLSAAFTNKVLDFNTKSMSRPMEIAWCGDDAVVLLWRNTGAVIIGPDGDWLDFPYEKTAHLVAEPDCCRIITAESCDVLQRVPAPTESIRRIGSTDPAALVFDAMEAFEEGDPKSDENIRSIATSNQLTEAISACVQAASAEFDIPRQQSLLKAASYGKTFCHDADPTEFVETAKKLRILNQVREEEVGMPLTIQQYNRLTPEVLIGRLTMRNYHFLALKACELLQVRNERVLVHWAAEKVKKLASTTSSDEEICDTIKTKLQGHGRISFLEVAAAAYHMRRRKLATMILDMETHAADQVPLLLSMGEEELALRKAINSQDTDLIYLVLMHLEKSWSNTEMYHKLVHLHAEAANLLKMFYRAKVTASDRSVLHNLLMFNKQYLEAGRAAVRQANMQENTVSKVQLMKEASNLFGQGRSELSFFKTMTDEQVELMEIQKSLEIRAHRDFVGLSLSETLQNMIKLGLEFPTDAALWERESAKLAKKFKIPDKTLWNIRIHCYSSTGHWAHLSKLASEKKSPVGYKPFAKACLKYKQPIQEVDKYIEKISDQEDKYEMYVEIASWRKAADAGRQLQDVERLQAVFNRCNDPDLQRQIQHIVSKL